MTTTFAGDLVGGERIRDPVRRRWCEVARVRTAIGWWTGRVPYVFLDVLDDGSGEVRDRTRTVFYGAALEVQIDDDRKVA